MEDNDLRLAAVREAMQIERQAYAGMHTIAAGVSQPKDITQILADAKKIYAFLSNTEPS